MAERHHCDVALIRIAALVHGVIKEVANVKAFLADRGTAGNVIHQIIRVARESQAEATPSSLEGRILHDAHLLEGDDHFLITKGLVTGSARGQSLAQTVEYMERQFRLYRCCFPENQEEMARRLDIARRYLKNLKAVM